MTPARHPLSLALALTLLVALPASSAAPAGPKTQVWIDVATHEMAGMPDLGALGGLGSFAGKMMGGGGQDQNSRWYPEARQPGMPGKYFDVAMLNTLKPGTGAEQLVPAGLGVGKSLPLLPPPASTPTRSEHGQGEMHDVEVTLHEYWGCGATVRKGQPNTVKLRIKNGEMQNSGQLSQGRYAPDRDVDPTPAYVLWPNSKAGGKRASANSSLVGQHRITGAGVPESLSFELGRNADFMPRIVLSSTGGLADAINMSWQPVDRARAYFLHAMAIKDASQNSATYVMWSSAESGGAGAGMVDYLTGSKVDQWLQQKLLLPTSTTACTIPKGIFAGTQTGGENPGAAPLTMIAYGPETHITWPPKPSDPKQPWTPEWNVRVRTKSTTMAMLGIDLAGRDDPAQSDPDQPPKEEESTGKKLLKGLFNRL